MSAKKIWLIVAIALIVIGGGVFGLSISGTISEMGNSNLESDTYDLNETFNNISIDTLTSDINLSSSTTGKNYIVVEHKKDQDISVAVSNNTLSIKEDDKDEWDGLFSISFKPSSINIYLTSFQFDKLSISEETGDIEISNAFKFNDINIEASTGHVRCKADAVNKVGIKTSTGHVTVRGVKTKDLDITVSTGDIDIYNSTCSGDINIVVTTGKTNISNTTCKNLTSTGSTGSIDLDKVIVGDKLSIDRSTGDVELESCDANEIYINTDTGEVKGSLLTDKVFLVDSDTGEIDVPRTITGGRCEISTDTGDIKISIENK